MPIVCGIRFRGTNKVYYFAPGECADLMPDDHVIVETSRGQEMGRVVLAPREVPESEVVGELKPVLRRATNLDIVEAERYQQQEEEAIRICREQVLRLDLPMKIAGAEYSYDGSRLVFFFTSELRVDFRHLVRELAHFFKTRIELRQIGVRDEARIVGGVGRCGRPLCCATWLNDFSPVSIRMAKAQNLPLSPMEISGLCGRLLCCLTYEDDYYQEIKGRFPKVGKTVETPLGPAKVVKVSALRETVTLLMADGSTVELTADQLNGQEPIEDKASSRARHAGALSEKIDQAVSATLERPRPSSTSATPPYRSDRGRRMSDLPESKAPEAEPRRGQSTPARPAATDKPAAIARSPRKEGGEPAKEDGAKATPQTARSSRRRRSHRQGEAGRPPAIHDEGGDNASQRQRRTDEAAPSGESRPGRGRRPRRPADVAKPQSTAEPAQNNSQEGTEGERPNRRPRRRRANPPPRE